LLRIVGHGIVEDSDTKAIKRDQKVMNTKRNFGPPVSQKADNELKS
ncbi:hypothetical protein AVEN_138355-1, partial [Araneus ventricosus]